MLHTTHIWTQAYYNLNHTKHPTKKKKKTKKKNMRVNNYLRQKSFVVYTRSLFDKFRACCIEIFSGQTCTK